MTFYASIAAGVCTIWLGFEPDPDPGFGHGFKIARQISQKSNGQISMKFYG